MLREHEIELRLRQRQSAKPFYFPKFLLISGKEAAIDGKKHNAEMITSADMGI